MSDESADPAPPDNSGSIEQRVDTLETKLDRILGILDRDDDGPAPEPDSGGGSNIAHEIRAQLDARDKQRAADDKAKADSDRVGALETRVNELAEKPPQAPLRRSTRFMWGRE